MKAKLDKEFLLKNRFWIMIGLVPLLWLIAFLTLSTAVADERSKAEAKYEETFKNVKNVKQDVKNQEHTKYLKETERKLQAHKIRVWADVSKTQEAIFTWPSSSTSQMDRLARAKFGDDIPWEWRSEYGSQLYLPQFKPLEQPPRPVYYAGGWKNVLQPVEWKSDKAPTVEEVWLAQEDFWVKRELLNVVKAALDAVARFDDVTHFKVIEHDYVGKDTREGNQLGEGIIARQVCRSPNLEIALILQEKGGKEPEKKEPAAEKDAKPAAGDKPDEKKVLVLSAKSTLKNINEEKKPRKLDGLTLRLSQRRDSDKVETTLNIQGGELAYYKPKGAAKEITIPLLDSPLVLEGFNYREPIDIQITADKSDPLEKPYLARQRLRNANWELELLLEQAELNGKKELVISSKSKIKNVHPQGRTLNLNGVRFRVSQGEKEVTFTVQDEPLPWGQAIEMGHSKNWPVKIPGFNPRLDEYPLQVEQVLDWYTSPIKRIDAIQLGYNSDRTANLLAANNEDLKAKTYGSTDPNATPTTSTTPTSPTAPPSPTSAPPAPENDDRPRGEYGFGGVGARPNADLTPNGLDRKRYYEINDQVRRIPFGMALVVDQAYIQDVLTAFENSRLRIEPCQHHYQQIRGVRPYSPEEEERQPGEGGDRRPTGDRPIGGRLDTAPPRGEDDRPRRGVGVPLPEPGPSRGPGPLPGPGPGPGGIRPTPGGTGPEDQTSAVITDDPNLVQLTFYGIAALYERYRPPAEQPSGK
jgi:hypothetical protein